MCEFILLRPSGKFLLFPCCDTHRIQVEELFVVQPRQRVRESSCSLGVRHTPPVSRCLPLPKETHNLTVLHCTIPLLRYDGPAEVFGTCSKICVSLLNVHNVASTMTAPLVPFFSFEKKPVHQECYLRPLVPDLTTLHAAEMPTKDTAKDCILRGGYRPDGFDEVLTNTTKAAGRARVPRLTEEILSVSAGSDAPVGDILSCASQHAGRIHHAGPIASDGAVLGSGVWRQTSRLATSTVGSAPRRKSETIRTN